MFLLLRTTAEEALRSGSTRCGDITYQVSLALAQEIASQGLETLASRFAVAKETHTNASRLPSPATDKDVLVILRALREECGRLEEAVAAVRRGEDVTVPTPSTAVPEDLRRQAEYARQALGLRQYLTQLRSDPRDPHRHILRSGCTDLACRNAAELAFGSELDAVRLEVERSVAETEALREAERAAEYAARCASYAEEERKKEAAEQALRDEQRQQTEGLLCLVVGETDPDAVLERFKANLLPERELWDTVRSFVAESLDGVEHKTPHGYEDCDCVTEEYSTGIRLSATEYRRLKGYREGLEKLRMQLAPLGLLVVEEAYRQNWECTNCGESGHPHVLRVLVQAAGKLCWRTDLAL